MRAGNKIFVGVLLLGLAGGYLFYEKSDVVLQYLPKSLAKYIPGKVTPIPGYRKEIVHANEWTNDQAVQQKLQDIVDKQLKGTSPEDVRAFLRRKSNELALDDLALIQAQEKTAAATQTLQEGRQKALEELNKELEKSTPKDENLSPRAKYNNQKKAERIAAIQQEFSVPDTMEELANDPEAAEILEKVTSDLTWSDQIANSGETAPTGKVISILSLIAKTGKVDLYGNKLERDIATATALEFARSGWSKNDAVNRAVFHVESWHAGKMNPSFASLPFWQKRMVCGLKGKGIVDGVTIGNDSAGNVRSLNYSQQNAHLPAYRCTGACWQAPYRMFNVFGDVIHNSTRYFAPFKDSLGEEFNSLTRFAGGVCGGLSHYGATTAVANGVPATTSGEPGHCSYIVRVGDKWVPSYSLSWNRGLHWQVFNGCNKFSALHMADNLFSEEQMPKTRESQAMRNLASSYEQTEPEKAEALYNSSVQTQPLNYYAWRDYANFLTQDPEANQQKILAFCDLVNNFMVTAYPEMAASLMQNTVYPALKKVKNLDKAALQNTIVGFWNKVNTMGPDAEWDKSFGGRWDVETLLTKQADVLGINLQNDARATDFMRSVLGCVSDKTAYLTTMLSWANSLCEKMKPELQSNFLAAMIQGVTGGSTATDAEREKMFNSVILSAEKTGDINSFNAIAKSLPSSYSNPARKIPAPEPFPGKLVSQGGIILASSTCQYDHPCAHWGVLEPGIGGGFHTGRETDAWVRVTLPKQAKLSGVILRTTDGNLQRHNNMIVQVSETGRDNDWHSVAELGVCKEKLIRVDLTATHPLAKYVRILRKGGPEFFHLLGIYVYGDPAA